MKKLRGVISIICALTLVSTSAFAMEIEKNSAFEDTINYESEQREAKTDELFAELMHNNLEKVENENMRTSQVKEARNSDIIEELEKLGVTELSQQEVEEQFPGIAQYDLNVKVPGNSNGVAWYLDANYTRTYNGGSYNVAVLRAIPSKNSGALWKQARTIDYTERSSFQVGKKNLIKYTIKDGVTTTISHVAEGTPIVGTALKLYDVVTSVMSGVKTTDKVEEIHTSVNVVAGTGVKFVYVNKANNPSDYQVLQLVTTMVDATASWEIPTLTISGKNFKTDIITGKSYLTSYDRYYDNSASSAVEFYAKGYSERFSYVSADIVVNDGKTESIPTVTPRFPVHIM